MKITTEQLDQIAAKLKSAPPVARPMSTTDALRRLAPSLKQMRARGYTIDQIADMLKAEGLSASPATLKRVLSSPKRAAPKPVQAQSTDN